MELEIFEKIWLMFVDTPGMMAPAATATKPAISAYSIRSWPLVSLTIVSDQKMFFKRFMLIPSPCNSLWAAEIRIDRIRLSTNPANPLIGNRIDIRKIRGCKRTYRLEHSHPPAGGESMPKPNVFLLFRCKCRVVLALFGKAAKAGTHRRVAGIAVEDASRAKDAGVGFCPEDVLELHPMRL